MSGSLPIPPRPPLDIMRELERPTRRPRMQEFDVPAAIAAEQRKSASRQSLPLPPIPPAVAPPRTAGESAEAGPPRVFPGETAGDAVPPRIGSVLPADNPWVSEAIRLAEKYDLPRDVFLSMVYQESGFNPEARSRKGAYGLTQLMPGTAADLRADRYDPAQNLDAGARYLRQQIDRFGSLPLALAAYNAGPNRVAQAGNQIPRITETQDYVKNIMRRAGVEGYAEGGRVRESLIDMEDRYADGGTVRRPAAAPVPSPSDLNYLDMLAARAVGGAGVDELRSSEGRNFAPMPRNASEALQRMSAVVRGDVEPTPEEERQISQVRGFTEGPASIRAYHGSPHRFERFDISKVGEGEGAQAQGHGLYFAEYEPIAKWYRESTAGGPITTDFSVGNIPLIRRERPVDYTPTRYDPESIAKSTLQEALLILEPSLRNMPDNAARVGAVKETIQRLISDEGYPAEATRYWNRVLSGLEEGRTPLRYSVEQPGHMYEVNLRTTPERLLDWDQPLNLQPDPVREALRSRFGRDYEKLEGMTNYRPGGGGMRGEDFYESYLGGKDQAPFASQQLQEVGIPGVRYLDARSRAAGEGSRNYVMFDDTLIDLLRRYGLMGTVGAGAAVAGAEEMAQ